MNKKFEVVFLQEAAEFIDTLDEKVRLKILFNIRKSQVINDPRLFKKLNSSIWEFRAKYENLQYRLLAFWDKSDALETLVILTHGIVKKVDKVPVREIEKAESIRRKYLEEEKSNRK